VSAPAAVVFDFDGVLADTERLHLAAFQDVFRARGWQLDEAAYFNRYLGFEDRDLVRAFAIDARIVLDPDDEARLVEAKARAYDARLGERSVLFPGAAEAVSRLQPHYRLGVASGSRHAEIEVVLGAAGLVPAFTAIVAADDVTRSKPAPDVYQEAVRRLGVPAARAVAVEDSRWGLAAARAAGLRTIGLTTSYPAPTLATADLVVASLDAVTVEAVAALLDDSMDSIC